MSRRRGSLGRGAARPRRPSTRGPTRGTQERREHAKGAEGARGRERERERTGYRDGEGARARERERENAHSLARRRETREYVLGGRNKSARPPSIDFLLPVLPTSSELLSFLSHDGHTTRRGEHEDLLPSSALAKLARGARVRSRRRVTETSRCQRDANRRHGTDRRSRCRRELARADERPKGRNGERARGVRAGALSYICL